jgi:hypothetical protein
MWKALLLAACLLVAPASLGVATAQQPFVIVPDNPGSGGGGGGGDAVTRSALNVRAGPGTRYAVIDVLQRGARVQVDVCQNGWCWISHRGPSGWVSQNHLDRVGSGGGSGSGSVVRPSREACFYESPRFRGRSFCAVPGDSDRSLGAWNNRIGSISIRGLPTVQVCVDRNFIDCEAFNRDVPNLPWWLDQNISSFRVLH